jgi:hypothetical protein
MPHVENAVRAEKCGKISIVGPSREKRSERARQAD